MTSPEEIADVRRLSFAIAYRMLGSVSEAEDIAQEALLRLHRSSQEVESPRGFVATVTTRLAIDELRSARARRETYVGEWLPEPVLTEGPDDPAAHAELADSLSMALLIALETLSPEQRAVLLLRDVFDYSFAEIARIVGKREDNVRKIAARARRGVEGRRARFETSASAADELARRFLAAAREGDLAGLEELLAADVVLTGDGGGQVPALARSLHGRGRVARTLRNWMRAGARLPGASLSFAHVNGSPGALLRDGEDRLIGVWEIEVSDGLIVAINSVVNPDKLRHLGPVADLEALLAGSGRTRGRGSAATGAGSG